MTFFTCHCWSRTPRGRDGYTKTLRERYEKATQLDFEVGNNEEDKVKDIWDSVVYAKESEAGHLPELGLSGAASASTLPPLLGQCGQ